MQPCFPVRPEYYQCHVAGVVVCSHTVEDLSCTRLVRGGLSRTSEGVQQMPTSKIPIQNPLLPLSASVCIGMNHKAIKPQDWSPLQKMGKD